MLFYKDITNNTEKTYSDLIEDIKSLDRFFPYCYTGDYYIIFRSIVHSLLLGKELTLLDSDFSKEEILSLAGDVDISGGIPVEKVDDLCLDNLRNRIEEHAPGWKVTLFTSGTTGLPKKVSHSYTSLTRYLKRQYHDRDIWGFAYNPTHIAGLQVFFQALMNFNPIIRLFGLDKNSIFSLIEYYSISHISATPTFYRLLLPTTKRFLSVKRITSGGEKFDSNTSGQLLAAFPNAKLTNVYASTEAGTLFASDGENFVVKPSIRDLVKVVDNVLFIHKSLLGESESIQFDKGWYNTGDIVEVLAEAPLRIRFVPRQNEMINVGGYKVNPTEVEQAVRDIPGVKDAYVYAKANRLMGNVICCDVIVEDRNLTERSIRGALSSHLQEFKIPRIVRFTDSLKVTRTGKKDRTQ